MTVSVIIPNYNHSEYLKQRIDSILNQTYKDFEIIILDDCSTDDSRKIIDDYTSRFPFIKSYYNIRNSGSPFIQWDYGVSRAKGYFIWIAESDDYAEADFLEKTTEVMFKYESVGLVYCDSKVIDELEKTEYLVSAKKASQKNNKWLHDYMNKGKDEIAEYLFLENSIYNASSVLFRKSRYLEAGGAGNSMKFCGDWFLYIRILMNSDISYISVPLNNFRRHSGSSVHDYFRTNKYLMELMEVYSFVRKQIALSPKMKFLIFWRISLTICRRLIHIDYRKS